MEFSITITVDDDVHPVDVARVFVDAAEAVLKKAKQSDKHLRVDQNFDVVLTSPIVQHAGFWRLA